ncbi:MAG: Rieske 2Fe-2S domain-containing protein [Deltaproteobacteria bacterium]|nr:Rieske 2Fe-2S domain-containing protein [Deltaproteobacteria bacterium]
MISKEENQRLTQIKAGTPVGDLLRRYWYPIAAVSELARHPTKFVKLLGEELVLFKEPNGKLGLIDAYCAHRRANLVYGMPEEGGVRCSYHGWKFNGAGQCVEQPLEETLNKCFKEKIQLTHYIAEELGGLIFGYIGPQPAPLVPHWDLLVEENSWREVGYTLTRCNWLQAAENILDPVHVEWLHGVFRNYSAERTGRTDRIRKRVKHLKVGFDLGEFGIIKRRILEGEDEESDDWKKGHWLIFPCTQKGPDMLRFRVPVDETHTAQWYYSIHPLEKGETQTADEMPLYHMPSPELDWHGQPQFQYLDNDVDPQDNAIFISQGPVYDRTKEMLGESDHGLVLYRHLIDNQIKLIAAGKDPINTFRDPAKNQRIELETESRDKFLTGRLGARARYSQRFKPLADPAKPLP